MVAASCTNTEQLVEAAATKAADKAADRVAAKVSRAGGPAQTGKLPSGNIPPCGASITIDFSNNTVNVPPLCYAIKGTKLQWTVSVQGQVPAAGSDDGKFSIEFDTSPFKNKKTHIDDRDTPYEVLEAGAGNYVIRSYSVLYKQNFVDPQIIIGGGN
jgi:hypothetical protein